MCYIGHPFYWAILQSAVVVMHVLRCVLVDRWLGGIWWPALGLWVLLRGSCQQHAGPQCSVSSATLDMVCLIDFSPSVGLSGVLCGFYLHFSDE